MFLSKALYISYWVPVKAFVDDVKVYVTPLTVLVFADSAGGYWTFPVILTKACDWKLPITAVLVVVSDLLIILELPKHVLLIILVVNTEFNEILPIASKSLTFVISSCI